MLSGGVTDTVVDLLSRYPARNRFDQRENRLTAAVSAALQTSPGLCAHLSAELWRLSLRRAPDLPITTKSDWRARFQRAVTHPTRPAWFIDLEIRSRQAGILIWIEAKVDSELSGRNQLSKYAEAL